MLNEEIQKWANKFVEDYKLTRKTLTSWNKPEIAFASASDPLFLKLNKVISETHSQPKELLKTASTVIVYFLPFKEDIAKSNQGARICSEEWAHAYVETNKLIAELNFDLAQKLIDLGFEAKKMPATHNFNEEELISDWSHKHVGYIAGLGKLGLHKMLITKMGSCGRLGSIITSAEIQPTKRNEDEYCLYFHNNSCSKCVDNCIFDALKINGLDKHTCYKMCLKNANIYSHLGLVDACGKCVSVVPCSFKNPVVYKS